MKRQLRLFDNRGKILEDYLDNVCEKLNDLGYHAHKNQPKRTYEGFYLAGEPFDYEIFASGQVHCFDAKENFSGKNEWQIMYSGNMKQKGNEKMMRQTINLCHCAMNGAQGYFLVYFGNNESEVFGKLIRFDAVIIYDALLKRQRKIHYSLGTLWDIRDIINGGENSETRTNTIHS